MRVPGLDWRARHLVAVATAVLLLQALRLTAAPQADLLWGSERYWVRDIPPGAIISQRFDVERGSPATIRLRLDSEGTIRTRLMGISEAGLASEIGASSARGDDDCCQFEFGPIASTAGSQFRLDILPRTGRNLLAIQVEHAPGSGGLAVNGRALTANAELTAPRARLAPLPGALRWSPRTTGSLFMIIDLLVAGIAVTVYIRTRMTSRQTPHAGAQAIQP